MQLRSLGVLLLTLLFQANLAHDPSRLFVTMHHHRNLLLALVFGAVFVAVMAVNPDAAKAG